MRFRLFGVDIEIQLFFWLTAFLLGFEYRQSVGHLIVWILIVLVSVLVHEFGHAFAVMRHRIEPEITLHGMGGSTSYRAVLPIGRVDQIVISAAGPFAGFTIAAFLYALTRLAPGFVSTLPPLAQFAIDAAYDVNLGWGIFNLIPVLPFDGGHILEQALGPKRARLSAGLSCAVGVLAAGYFVRQQNVLSAVILGIGALRSFQRWSAAESFSVTPQRRRNAPPREEPVPAELAALLQSARHALAEDDVGRTRALAQQVLEAEDGSPRAHREALELLAWTHLLENDARAATDLLTKAKKLGEPDAALAGAVLFARRDLTAARRVLEEARARGDDRKEVVGLLIQILLEQGEIARAAAVALDIVDALSVEDARKMAQISLEHRAYDWSARLSGAIFERERLPDDAYDAARAMALDGNHEHALGWLRKAVEAGFQDRARAWSDAALVALRGSHGLETVLPRP
jgi:Zn-dependent protease